MASAIEAKPYPDFFQDPPRLGNQFSEDDVLQSILLRLLGEKTFKQVQPDLVRFGARCGGELMELAEEMEMHPPTLTQYDSWGNRIDQLNTCAQWKAQHVVSAEEGLISLGYSREWGARNRIVQFAKLALYAPSSGLYSCPLAMTDGAARLCALLMDSSVKLNSVSRPLSGAARQAVEKAYQHLTSRKGDSFWTSGQWMTERGGGSDVGDGTTTVARLQPDGSYKLYGFKWFTSATDSQMTITLARIEDEKGQTQPSGKGLSCFILRVKEDNGTLNNIRIHRLKNKLGTKQLPTAELELLGSTAYLLSDPGRGVALITTLVNITRLHNAISSVAGMRRMIALMRDYAHRRTVFGTTLSKNLMHLETLAEAEVQMRAAALFTFDVTERLGRSEIPSESTPEDDMLLRLLTPLVKLYTAKQAVSVASEGLESFGGQGYIECSRLPRLMRDAQVLPIWEGTTNVLSHDLLRVLTTSKGAAFAAFKSVVSRRTSDVEAALPAMEPQLRARMTRVLEAWRVAQKELESYVTACMTGGKAGAHALESQARILAYATSRVYIASTMAVHALFTKQHIDWVVLERWVMEGDAMLSTATSSLIPNVLRAPISANATRIAESRILALNIDPRTQQPRGCGNFNQDGTPRSKL